MRLIGILRVLLLSFALTCGFACPGSKGEAEPVEDCTSVGEQCRLGAGKLGVCTMNARDEIECEPQH